MAAWPATRFVDGRRNDRLERRFAKFWQDDLNQAYIARFRHLQFRFISTLIRTCYYSKIRTREMGRKMTALRPSRSRFAVEGIDSLLAAQEGGADRIELCAPA
jgi:hypothetical protein